MKQLKVRVKPFKYRVPVRSVIAEDYVVCLSGARRKLMGGVLPCLPREVCIGGKCKKVKYELIESKLSPVFSEYRAEILGKKISGEARAEGPILYLFDPFEGRYFPFKRAGITRLEVSEAGISVEFSTGPFTHLNVRIEVFSLDWKQRIEEPNSGFVFIGLNKPWGFARIELFSPFWEFVERREIDGKWIGIERDGKWLYVGGCLKTEKVQVKGVTVRPERAVIYCRTGKRLEIEKDQCVKKSILCVGKVYAEILDRATGLSTKFELD